MDETDRGKVVRFFLAGSVLCLVGMFFSFYLKGFILYGSQFGRKYKIIGVTYMIRHLIRRNRMNRLSI